MFSGWKKITMGTIVAAGMIAGMAGCASSEGPQRPPVDQLDSRDRGLQSMDINQAADKMAAELLSDPALNGSKTQWTMVVDHIDNKTTGQVNQTDFDLFIQALRSRVFKQGRGRVQLIVNKAKFHEIRDLELEGPPAAAVDATQPEYTLTGVARDLPRQGTVYYQIEFTAMNNHNRQVAWTGLYTVKVGL